jgi:hypothetical protein
VCVQVHFNVSKVTGVKLDSELWYEHVPKFVETCHEGKVTVLWNQQVETHRTIPNNENIIIQGNEKRTCMLIYVASSGDRSMIKKDGEESLQYKDLTIEIQPICKNKSDTSNNRGNWNPLRIIQKIPE